MPDSLLIRNGRLFDAAEDDRTDILVRGGKIAAIGKIADAPDGVEVLDAGGRTVAPGFIDVHIQGAGGASVLDGTGESLGTISRTLAALGTTGFLATTVFKPGGDNRPIVAAAENAGRNLGGARLLGIHLEGPFVSLEKKGGVLPDSICPPSPEILKEIRDLTAGQLKMMTVAPELPGCLPLIERLVAGGTVASFGHSAASYRETKEGIRAGISHVTHLFNAMVPIHHREPGPVPAVFEEEGVTAQVITDGVHLHPAVVRLAFRLLGDRRFTTITDGLTSTGLPDGQYTYDGVRYTSTGGTARRDRQTLVGTTLGLNRMIGRLMDFTGCGLAAAVRTVTEAPARALGIEREKGSLTAGRDADIVILNGDLSVFSTIVGGRRVC